MFGLSFVFKMCYRVLLKFDPKLVLCGLREFLNNAERKLQLGNLKVLGMVLGLLFGVNEKKFAHSAYFGNQVWARVVVELLLVAVYITSCKWNFYQPMQFGVGMNLLLVNHICSILN